MSNENNLPRVIWYGERGIINSIVSYFENILDDNEYLCQVKNLLNGIHWADGNIDNKKWIDDIISANFVVEVGLNDFGDPDLIIVCKTKNDIFCIFVEAKVDQYLEKASSNQQGMKYKGYNSSINGQLSLKYRFIKALKSSLKDDLSSIEEIVSEHYKKILNDKLDIRVLKKRDIISLIIKKLEIDKIDDENFFIVALTWDSFEKSYINFTEEQKDFLPVILNDGGENIYDSIKTQFGWINYDIIKNAIFCDKSLEITNESFEYALLLMNVSNSPDSMYYEETKRKLHLFPNVTKFVNERLKSIFENNHLSILELPGSYSINFPHITDNLPHIKILPEIKNDKMFFIGFRPEIINLNIYKGLIPKKVIRTTFYGLNFDITKEDQNIENIKILTKIIADEYDKE